MYFLMYQQEIRAFRSSFTRKSMAACRRSTDVLMIPGCRVWPEGLTASPETAQLQHLDLWWSQERRWTSGPPPSLRWTCRAELRPHQSLRKKIQVRHVKLQGFDFIWIHKNVQNTTNWVWFLDIMAPNDELVCLCALWARVMDVSANGGLPVSNSAEN